MPPTCVVRISNRNCCVAFYGSALTVSSWLRGQSCHISWSRWMLPGGVGMTIGLMGIRAMMAQFCGVVESPYVIFGCRPSRSFPF